ncbi:hypothetical protein FBZ83_1262 [Azospirillum brasilense]|uniref:Uncharacterized protein n=1 Tax=Azospirillum brasilense TaxID=192 RepID=A0A560BMT8_AZOBR|nr:phage tail length tape measure family protein [Azospirillum brasilense]TWA73935.1 hypothetical protein FBZ83_1262 [Azospirillum brasilense]
MAVELAQALIHEVVVDDSKAVAGAQNVSRAMDGMATASDKATAAATKQVSGLRLLDEATVKLSRAQESAWGALQKWKAVADDNERAMQRLARAEADLNRAVRQGVADEEEKIRVLDQLRQKLSGYAVANDNAAASTGRFKGALGNMGLQLQDVAVQAQMGTSAFIILAQQGPQIASAFGPMGIAIGTVVSIASVAAGVLFTLGDETKKSAKEIDTFGDVLGIFEGRARESGAAIETLTDSYRALGGELRALSKLALQADIATLTEKQAKDQKSAWDTIRNATMAGAKDVPASLSALQQLGQDKDLAGFLGKLQALNEKGAIKLMRDEDIRALLETGEALRVAEARMADLEGRATPAQKALLGYADAAREAAKAAAELATSQAKAGASLFTTERDLDAKIQALKGGEAAMKAYGEEQVRTQARSKAYDDAIHSGLSTLDATAEANRIAAKAVEAYRLEQQRADEQTAANAASRKAESQAERDAKAYAKVSEELDRGIAEQQRLAGVVGQSVEAQREANTQTKIAEALSKAHTTASTAEGKAIAGKVREQEKWRATAADAAVLDSSKRQLAYAQQELSLMGQAEPVRARALKSFQIQQEAGELAKTTTAENVAEWVRLQEQIADTQAIKAFRLEVQGEAKEMSRDVTEALLDREAKWRDVGKTIGKRIALGFLENQFVMPIMTTVVGAVPSLFGIQGPATAANMNAANQNGAAGLTGQATDMATNWGAGKALSWAGDKLGLTGGFDALMNTPVWGSAVGMSSTGAAAYTGTLVANPALAGPGLVQAGSLNAANGVVNAGNTAALNASYSGTTTGASGTAGATLGGVLGTAGAGFAAGSLLGGWAGTSTNSKVVGGLSGAGAGAAAGAAMGTWVFPGVGTLVGALIGGGAGGLGGLIGTQKASVGPNAQGNVVVSGGRFAEGPSAADNKGDATGVRQATAQIAAAFNSMADAYGLRAPDGTYGLYTGGDKVKGNGVRTPEELIRQIVGSLSADGLVGRALGSDVVKGSADLEQINSYLSLAKRIEATTTALDGLDKSLGGVQKAAFKAAGEGLQPMLEELKKAGEIGASAEYKALVSGQVSSILDDIANPRAYTETETAVATLTGQLAAWKSVLEQVNPDLAKTVDAIQEKGLERINKGVRDTFAANLNEANDKGFLNQLADVRKTWDAGATDALKAGVKPEDYVRLYDAQARRILDGLDNSQIDGVVSYFKDLDPVMAGLADSLRGTTTAAKEAQKAVQSTADSLTAWLNGQKLGDASSLSPVAKMEEAQRQFDAALSASRKSGDISGATKAADALLSASKPVLVMGTEGYSQREDWITSTLKNLGHELGLPGFATGGDHLGGLRIVGERGPELEWTGPSRIFSADQTRQILAGATAQAAPQVTVNVDMLPVMRAVSQSTNEVVSELRRLRQEVAELRAEKRTGTNLKLAGAA